jgi:3-methylcrotonyl-CoA carboxylase alpha subunit
MIRRLLIANRGEIAVRIARACRELGIESVAVYSDADRMAPHVLVADRSEHIGGSPASDSYLNLTAVLDAAERAGADAVHPGYGFLSERAAFADACRDRALIFVGPPSSALARMGSKIEARRLMQEAGVPVIPGATPEDQSDASLAAAVETIGFPALIKPSAGGGGIGMKAVRTPRETVEAVQRARREAHAAFGDGTLYVERLIEHPRHVEVQIVADSDGNVVHLFERECSIQRRHQKVIEESPCPGLKSSLRQQMGEAAVAAAKAVQYVNAGTVEFLLEQNDGDARFYFVEMNTRLQVEHPVTELVTGTDLVYAQLVVASGGKLPWTQESLIQRGHAIECRIYAEDPSRDFLPQAGPLLMYREPQGPGIRVDAGIVEGGDVSVFYDPLLAKLIVHGETRAAAIRRATAALRRYIVLGIHTNIPLLSAILQHPRFNAGDLDTEFLDAEQEALRDAMQTGIPPAALAAVAVHDHHESQAVTARGPLMSSGSDPFETLRRWGLP